MKKTDLRWSESAKLAQSEIALLNGMSTAINAEMIKWILDIVNTNILRKIIVTKVITDRGFTTIYKLILSNR